MKKLSPLEKTAEQGAHAKPNFAARSIVLVITVLAGLGSRRFSHYLPAILSKNAGDILWAVMVFELVCWAAYKRQGRWHAAISLGIAFAVEMFKWVHFPALDQFRLTLSGKLLLGTAFSISNLICYSLGIGIAYAVHQWVVPSRQQ
jgi:Protein of unknown function (DUF2809)